MQYKKKTIKIIGNITYFSLNFKVKVEKKCQKPKSERLQGLQSEYKLCLPISSMTKSGLHQFLKQNHSQSTSSQKQNWLTLLNPLQPLRQKLWKRINMAQCFYGSSTSVQIHQTPASTIGGIKRFNLHSFLHNSVYECWGLPPLS